jgi:hypothetical protein
MWRVGRLMSSREDIGALDAADRAQFIDVTRIMAAHMHALRGYLETGSARQHDDAVKCLVLFAACALGSDGRPWEQATVQLFSQGLYHGLDQSPEEFVTTNMHVLDAIMERVDALHRDLVAASAS